MQQTPQPDRVPAHVGSATMIISIAVIIAAGAFLRFDRLVERDIWLDESCTFYAVHNLLDWPDAGPDFVREVAHTPYFLLLHAWTSLMGETAFGLRSFSASMGCLTIALVAGVGASLGGRRVGLIAAALIAVHPLHIYYSQEARVYAMWIAVATVTLYALTRAARAVRVGWWVVYGVCVWCLVLTHYYSLLWLPATVTVLAIVRDRRQVFRRWLITHVVLAVTLAPLVLFVIMPNAATGPRVWLAETWHDYPPALALLRSLWALLPSGGYPRYLGSLHLAAEALGDHGWAAAALSLWAPALLAVILVLAGGVLWRGPVEGVREDSPAGRAQVAITRHVPAVRFLLGGVLIFLAIAWAYSLCVRPAYVVGRYDVIALPAVVLALALLVSAMPTAWREFTPVRSFVSLAITVALCGCSLLTLASARIVPVKQVQADRARQIARVVGENDLIVSVNLYRWFMEYEWGQLGFSPHIISFPPAHDRQMCWDDALGESADPGGIEAAVSDVVSRIKTTLAAGDRVWLLAHGEPAGPRWEVDSRFFAGLRAAGIDVRPEPQVDGLARLVMRSDEFAPDTQPSPPTP